MAKEIAYCPRCDRPFAGATKAEALALVDAHIDRAHPDYREMAGLND